MKTALTIVALILFLTVQGLAQGNLVAEWNMSNGSGTTVTDVCCGQNLTITPGSGSWATLAGLSEGVYSFDGTTTVMNASGYAGMNFNYNQPFSIAMWIDTSRALTGGAAQGLISRVDLSNSARGWAADMIYDTYFGVDWYPQIYLVNAYSSNMDQVEFYCGLSTNTLHLWVVTYNGNPTIGPNTYPGLSSQTSFTSYLDGGLCDYNSVRQSSLTATTQNTIDPQIGGTFEGSSSYQGLLGPVDVWSCALTAAEAEALYSNPYAPVASCQGVIPRHRGYVF